MANKPIDKIYKCVDEKKCFCFYGGAGSGKTYSLIKTIDHLIKKEKNALEMNGQSILVITYTNAAAEEIKERLGQSEVSSISTIHDSLWKTVSLYQKQLVQIHKEKMIEEKTKLEKSIYESEHKNDLVVNNLIKDNEFIDHFYRHQNDKAEYFKKAIHDYNDQTDDIPIRSVDAFKNYIKNSRKINKYSDCIKKIDNENETTVRYNALINYDRLDKMEFSHDTLLEYSKKLFAESKTIRRVFANKYPYILVDEFQDTNPLIIELLYLVEKEYGVTVGFYGDVFQNIYDRGVGGKLDEFFPGLIKIKIEDNRRSLKNIVEIANKVRNDDLFQNPKNTGSGVSEVLYIKDDNEQMIDSFISETINKVGDSNDSTACLILKNESVAKRNGFGDVFDFFKESTYYRRNYNQLNEEILSDDKTRLGRVPLIIFKMIQFYECIIDGNTRLLTYMPKELVQRSNYYTLIQIIRKIRGIDCNVLNDLNNHLCRLYSEDDDCKFIIDCFFESKLFINDHSLSSYIISELFSEDVLENEETKKTVTGFLNCNINEFVRWYNYLTSKNNNDGIEYLTFHNAKGREFDNLIVIISNNFNREKDYYHKYFKDTSSKEDSIIKRRNLLYVALTRARKNLYVLYIDENYDEIQADFENIFNNSVKHFCLD